MPMPSRCLLVVPIAVLLGACASAGGPATLDEPGATDESMSEAADSVAAVLAETYARFARALRVGDVEVLARVFVEDGALVLPDRRIIRGRTAIQEHFRDPDELRFAAARIEFGQVEVCRRTAHQMGTFQPVDGDPLAGEPKPSATAWVRQPDGSWRIRSVVLADLRYRSQVSGFDCAEPGTSAYFENRFRIFVYPGRITSDRGGFAEAFEDVFVERGWNYTIESDNVPIESFPQTERGKAGPSISARVAIRDPLGVELLAAQLTESSVAGYKLPDGRINLDHSANIFGLLAAYRWRNFYAAAGPLLVRNSWRWWSRSSGEVVEEAWQDHTTGFVASAEVVLPIFSRGAVSFGVRGIFPGAFEIRGYEAMPASRVNFRVVQFPISVGIGF